MRPRDLGVLLTMAVLLVGLAMAWQRHLDAIFRQCERLADRVDVLERMIYSEHPEYSSWVSTSAKCITP